MPSCALRLCKSRYGKTDKHNYSLFSFPPSRNLLREKWIRFVQIERKEKKWLPSAASKLCSKHFKKEDIYLGRTGRAILKKGAIPCFLKEEEETNRDDTRSITPNSVEVSDSESIFDSPKEIALKTHVQKLQKQQIFHVAKIKRLDHQNKYLKRRIVYLKQFVNHLKMQLHMQNNMTITLNREPETDQNQTEFCDTQIKTSPKSEIDIEYESPLTYLSD